MTPGAPRPGKLVFCHPSDEHYGADRVLLDICDVLPAQVRAGAEFWLPTDLGHGAHPLCTDLEARGVTVRHVDLPIIRRAYFGPRGLLALAWRALRLRGLLRRARPDVLYCTTSAAFVCAAVARTVRVPHVVGHVQEVWSAGDARVLALPGRFCHRFLTISAVVRDALPAPLRDRATVVRNATGDPGHVEPLAGRTGPLRYVIAGRWNPIKGHGTLLDAWDRLDSPGELVILGGAPPTGRRVDVAELVTRLRHPETVRVVGEVDDPGPYLDEADVVLVPSDDPEGFGLTAVEAFARGRPVLGSGFGGIREVVTEGRDGWLFPPRDAARLAEVLGGLTRDQVTEAGAEARRTYEREFTLERYAREWTAALEPALEPAPGAHLRPAD